MRLRASLLVCLCIFGNSAVADSWSSPPVVSLTSTNGEWSAEVIPSKTYYNKKAEDFAKVVLKRDAYTKEYQLLNPWAPSRSFLLNDGRLFTLDNWGGLGGGDNVAALYDNSGKVLWKRSLEELVDIDNRIGAMWTTSSIWWKKRPLEWQLDEAEAVFTLTLHNENKLKITLADGSSRTVEVHDLNDAPQRLLDRGMADLRSNKFETAEQHLKRAIELSPTLLEAYRGLARLYKQEARHSDAVAAFADIRETFKDYSQRHNLANLYCDLGEAYHALEDFEAEEAILRDAIELDTEYSYPVLQLAENLEAQNQTDAIAPLFDEFFETHSGQKFSILWITKDIGDYYANKNQHEAAIHWYLKVANREGLNKTLLYLSLAKSYEALGQTEDAIATYQRLIADEKAAGKGNYYIKQADKHIVRLSNGDSD